LIDPNYENLAGSPSLVSCTRDVYAPDTAFSLAVALRIAVGIAAATEHLHSRGILHGDLYAHNILVKTDGSTLLGDFGAACFFTGMAYKKALALQQLEARAFSCLLEELLQRCVPQSQEEGALAALWTLQARCGAQTVASRPLFPEICEELARLPQMVIQVI
jgi:serine/threonine protein kinase